MTKRKWKRRALAAERQLNEPIEREAVQVCLFDDAECLLCVAVPRDGQASIPFRDSIAIGGFTRIRVDA